MIFTYGYKFRKNYLINCKYQKLASKWTNIIYQYQHKLNYFGVIYRIVDFQKSYFENSNKLICFNIYWNLLLLKQTY